MAGPAIKAGNWSATQIAEECYLAADALLAERDRAAGTEKP